MNVGAQPDYSIPRQVATASLDSILGERVRLLGDILGSRLHVAQMGQLSISQLLATPEHGLKGEMTPSEILASVGIRPMPDGSPIVRAT